VTFRWTAADLTRFRAKESDIEKQKETVREEFKISKSDWQYHVEFRDTKVMVDESRIIVPNWIELEPEERSILEVLQLKLHQGLRLTRTRDTDETRVSR
jgi:hypothetical protein